MNTNLFTGDQHAFMVNSPPITIKITKRIILDK